MAENYTVVVADGTRARFFTLTPGAPKGEAGATLLEREDLISTEKEVPGEAMWGDVKSGRGTAPFGGPAHGYDDQRERHEHEFERRFAQRITDEAVRLAQQEKAAHLILVAETRLLGYLRNALHIPAHMSFGVHELAKDMTKKSLPEIGELFGGRDHTTVLHAVRKIGEERARNAELNQHLHVLEQTLKG